MRFVALLTILFSLNSLACTVYEAQFASVVKEVLTNENDPYSCKVKLDINLSQPGQRWDPHMMCPLDIELALDQYISVKYCGFKKGDPISGYIIQTEDGLELD